MLFNLLAATKIILLYFFFFHIIFKSVFSNSATNRQKQPFRGVTEKDCSENMQQIYCRAHMPKFDFNKVALHLF